MDKKTIQAWLDSDNVSVVDKEKIKAMSDEQLAVAFANKPLAFGTAGIRAKMGPGTQFLNSVTYYQMATGYGKFLKYKFPNQKISVIVAHDNRNNGLIFSMNVADVLTSLGIHVYLFEENQLASTPIVSYVIRKLKAQGAVIVTASHNPGEDNGFKIYDETGGQVLPVDGAKVVEFMPKVEDMVNLDVASDDRLITYLDESIFKDYYAACQATLIKTKVNEKKDFPIVFSGQHGTSCKRLPEYLKLLGYTNVICVKQQCIFDGNFAYTSTPNPENRGAWDLSLKYAQKHHANIIIQIDPDADRFAVAVRHHQEWRFLSGNQMGIIYTYYVLKNKKFTKPPFVVSSYVSTNLVDRIIKKYNGQVYRVGTGFKWIGNKAHEMEKAGGELVVGFEEAVGALNSTVGLDKDGYQAAALALEIYHEYQQKNMDLVDLLEKEIYGEFGVIYNSTIPFIFKGDNWRELAQQRLDKVLKCDKKKIGDRTITKIQYNEVGGCYDWLLEGDSWIRFRASGTEPKFKIYYNLYGDSLEALDQEAKVLDQELRAFLDL